jgi:hypothetical protein
MQRYLVSGEIKNYEFHNVSSNTAQTTIAWLASMPHIYAIYIWSL